MVAAAMLIILQENLNSAEKQWTGRFRRGKAVQRFDTILLSNVANLVDVFNEYRVSNSADVDTTVMDINEGRGI